MSVNCHGTCDKPTAVTSMFRLFWKLNLERQFGFRSLQLGRISLVYAILGCSLLPLSSPGPMLSSYSLVIDKLTATINPIGRTPAAELRGLASSVLLLLGYPCVQALNPHNHLKADRGDDETEQYPWKSQRWGGVLSLSLRVLTSCWKWCRYLPEMIHEVGRFPLQIIYERFATVNSLAYPDIPARSESFPPTSQVSQSHHVSCLLRKREWRPNLSTVMYIFRSGFWCFGDSVLCHLCCWKVCAIRE